MSREKMDAFVERWRADPQARFFALAHVTQTGASILDTIEAGPKSLATSIIERADAASRAHCDATGKLQRYSLAVLATGGKTIAQHFFPLAPENQADFGFAAGDTEEPTAKGQIRQSMRHTEAMARILVATTGEQNAGLREEIARLREESQLLRSKFFETLTTYEKLTTEATIRSIEMQTAQKREERADHALDVFIKGVVPVAIARMTGATPLVKLLQSLKPEQFGGLFATLTQEQMVLVKQMLSEAAGAEQGEAKLLGLTAVPGTHKAEPNGGAGAQATPAAAEGKAAAS